jgi:hypothetical protein
MSMSILLFFIKQSPLYHQEHPISVNRLQLRFDFFTLLSSHTIAAQLCILGLAYTVLLLEYSGSFLFLNAGFTVDSFTAGN